MVNDLAQRCGTPLLIHPSMVEEDLWRRLGRTLERAVNTLGPGGVLSLAIDAADNAVFAATQRGDRGFVPGLVGLRLPARVTVVLTARSHRVDPSALPGGHVGDRAVRGRHVRGAPAPVTGPARWTLTPPSSTRGQAGTRVRSTTR